MAKRFVVVWLWILVTCSSVAAQPKFAGTWATTYGPMTLIQEGNKVKGSYVTNGATCTLEGQVEKTRLTFTYQEPNVRGEGWLELGVDETSFKGKWQEKPDSPWAEWAGTRTVAVLTPGGYDGLWETTFGRMRLVHEENEVRGVYAHQSGSSIRGTAAGKTLKFTFKESQAEGEGSFELAADGRSFQGQWRANGSSNWSPWSGKRVDPVPGRTWLVVVEARWEKSLADKEYAFGDMLRAFFARTDHVQVRHRFFNDEAGLRKWCSEVAYLAEPTVLVLATHGDAMGIAADGQHIGPQVLADSLRHASNLKLLHFSACQIMKGRMGADIVAGIGKDNRFPISGYTTSVDWAVSAIIEFTYLDLILARRMTPADAASQLGKLLPFSGDRNVPGARFPSAGFRLLLPENRQTARTSAADRTAVPSRPVGKADGEFDVAGRTGKGEWTVDGKTIKFTYEFQVGGHLVYRSASGETLDGSWTQNGKQITVKVGKSTEAGTLDGKRLVLKVVNGRRESVATVAFDN